jgi:Zn-finger nucleic acid-binding protein
MDCPVCKKPMVILEYQNVELDFCVTCHGCWLDKGELGLILNGRMELPNDWTLVAERKSSRKCPRCGGRMREGNLAGTGVDVDVCANQHGLWFDRGELHDVVKSRGGAKSAEPLAQFIAEVFAKDDANEQIEHAEK